MNTGFNDVKSFFDKKKLNKNYQSIFNIPDSFYNKDKNIQTILNDVYKNFHSIINIESNDITHENANMNAETPSGMMMKFAAEVSKQYCDRYLIKNERTKQALNDNLLHIHDKDYYPTKSLTCVQYPLDKLLKYDFHTLLNNRPTKRIESASILTSIIFETAQNEMHGGQSVPAFDFYLAPFVRMTLIEEIKKIESILNKDLSQLYDYQIKDYISKEIKNFDDNDENCVLQIAINNTVQRVHQSMESFIHKMNTIHSRGGNQVVFSSINYGTDTSAEGRCIIRELLISTEQGVGKGATAIFPIQIWKKKRGVNYLPEDPNYDLYKLACRVTAKRFFPNFINLDATFNRHDKWRADDPERYKYEVVTMGCRTRIFDDRFGEKTSIGRGNLSFSTINIVRLALQCKDIKDYDERIKTFFSKFDNLLETTAIQLLDRYDFQKTAKAKQFPLLMKSLWINSENLNPEDDISSVIKHGTLGIGFIGLAECLIALTGKHHGESDESQKLGLEIISHMRDKIREFSDRYDKNFSVLATPAEGLAGKFVKKDREDFGSIKGITDKDYYTNSNHIPVYYHCSPQHKAKIEAPYHELTLGGHIFYVEMDGDVSKNVQAVMDVVDLMDKYNMGYGSVNHNRNHCLNCSYEDGKPNLKICPRCGSDQIETIQRITGYLVGTTKKWNHGKLSELKDRVIHE